MKKLRYIMSLIILLATGIIDISAQELSKEITIDKDIVPELKESNKINVSPHIPPLNLNTTPLTYNDRVKTSKVPVAITMLEPAENIDTITLAHQRGYAMLGYFPAWNVDLSAGYRIIDSTNVKLNTWLQYNGKSYKAKQNDGAKCTLDNNELLINADYSQKINLKSILSASVQYAYNNFSCPWIKKDFNQSVNRFSLGGKWESSIDGLDYNVNAGYSYFGYGKDDIYDASGMGFSPSFKAITEQGGYLEAGLSLEMESNTSVSLDFGASLLHYNQITTPIWDVSAGRLIQGYRINNDHTHTLLSLTPHYDKKNNNLTTKIGARLDFQIDDKNKFNISPDVYVDWAASNFISAYAHFSGGIYQNNMASVFDNSPYFSPVVAYHNSILPLVMDLGVNLGPFKGASIKVFGGYAKANDWLMPVYIGGLSSSMNHIMGAVDLDSWYVGIDAAYDYRNLFKMRACYKMAPQSYNKGYYLWRDRAKNVFNASVIVTPISPLDIMVDYEYRGGRCSYERIPSIFQQTEFVHFEHNRLSLGNTNSLSIGGLYRYDKRLSFFARVENLFNNKYDLLYDIASQGFTGMIGATYKF
ncbi:MAG: hypothetical protein E7081_00685 [Bacteroidales bacterium]|nr:hypothetical protein [Bacteroidales bacterium]